MTIPFTQFLRPDGERRDVTIDRPPEVEAAALRLFEAGCRFEIEVLRTLEVSMEVVGPADLDGDRPSLASLVVANGPGVPEAVDLLVREAENELARFMVAMKRLERKRRE